MSARQKEMVVEDIMGEEAKKEWTAAGTWACTWIIDLTGGLRVMLWCFLRKLRRFNVCTNMLSACGTKCYFAFAESGGVWVGDRKSLSKRSTLSSLLLFFLFVTVVNILILALYHSIWPLLNYLTILFLVVYCRLFNTQHVCCIMLFLWFLSASQRGMLRAV